MSLVERRGWARLGHDRDIAIQRRPPANCLMQPLVQRECSLPSSLGKEGCEPVRVSGAVVKCLWLCGAMDGG